MTDLLLGHSLGTSPAIWDRVVAQLPDEVRALAFPLPGHGAPPPVGEASIGAAADAVIDLADRRGIDRFYYAGVSIGGAIGLALALRHPDRLLGLGVVCAVAKFGESDAWMARAEQVRRSGTPVLVVPSAQRWFAPGFVAREPEAVGLILHDLSDTDDEAYAWYCEALARFDVRDRLGEISVPTVVLAGDHDEVADVDHCRAMAQEMRDARYETLEGCGHQGPIERPDQVATALLQLMGVRA